MASLAFAPPFWHSLYLASPNGNFLIPAHLLSLVVPCNTVLQSEPPATLSVAVCRSLCSAASIYCLDRRLTSRRVGKYISNCFTPTGVYTLIVVERGGLDIGQNILLFVCWCEGVSGAICVVQQLRSARRRFALSVRAGADNFDYFYTKRRKSARSCCPLFGWRHQGLDEGISVYPSIARGVCGSSRRSRWLFFT